MDKDLGTETKHSKESNVRRKRSLSASTTKRPRIRAVDIHRCISNVANLSLQTFATTFKHHDHSRYNLILDFHIQEEHKSRLKDEFETWRPSFSRSKSSLLRGCKQSFAFKLARDQVIRLTIINGRHSCLTSTLTLNVVSTCTLSADTQDKSIIGPSTQNSCNINPWPKASLWNLTCKKYWLW